MFRPPSSKSLLIRNLVGASLGRIPGRVGGDADGDDVACAAALVGAERVPGGWHVDRRGAAHWPGDGLLRVGESGTLARFATAVMALAGRPRTHARIEGRGTLARRRSGALFDALRGAGVEVVHPAEPNGWPVEVTPVVRPREVRLRSPESSQEVSALLIALAAAENPLAPDDHSEHRLVVEGEIPSLPYLLMTLEMLRENGAGIEGTEKGDRRVFRVGRKLEGGDYAEEGDASLAAVAVAGACLSGGSLELRGMGAAAVQGDTRFAEHLGAFGCRVEAGGGRGRPTRAADLDLSDTPDLAPVLAVVAAAAGARCGEPSFLRGLGTLPGKESDRLAVLAQGLRVAGWDATVEADTLRVGAPDPDRISTPVLLDPHGDHRMAFAFALLGLLRDDVLVADPGCVAKTWPSFWEDMERLGATVRSG